MENQTLAAEGSAVSVVFVKSHRARRLSITVKPFKPVRVTFPARVLLKKAQEFLESKLEWVKKAVNSIKKIEQQTAGMARAPKINKNHAKSILKTQLKFLADKHKFSYNRVFIRNQKTRWGSCSSKNNINLNINLVRLPQELQDYVILHELVHTKIKNHSKKFWNELDKYTGQSKRTARELRKHNLNSFHYAG